MRLAIEKNARLLALFAIACTTLVALVDLLTQERIEIQEQRKLLSTFHSIIDAERFNNDISLDCVIIKDLVLGSNQPQTAYLARLDGQAVAAAITTTAPDGYSGNIELLVAVNIDGSISGVRQLKHKETPGLGDKIERRKSDWIDSFRDKKLAGNSDPRWAVVKDGGMFDQFTGATITPRAVVNAVKRTAVYFNAHQQDFFSRESQCRGAQ
jgi:electron transport complex protein RnfG